MEAASGATILLRGQGSSRDPTISASDEPLHVLIRANAQEQIDVATQLVNGILLNPDKAMQLMRSQLHTQLRFQHQHETMT